jgi:hypothetical protein
MKRRVSSRANGFAVDPSLQTLMPHDSKLLSVVSPGQPF